MVSITLSVPEDLKKKMDGFPEMNWSAVAREAIANRVLMLEKFKKFTRDSTFNENEAVEFGNKVSEKAMKRHRA